MRSYSIKVSRKKIFNLFFQPLALHERIHNFDVTRPFNTLVFNGNFPITEAHSWLVLCVSQIPERCPQDESMTYNFQSTFNGGTMLQATYTFVLLYL
jgi:Bardet-Biedl syndrome 7 protein